MSERPDAAGFIARMAAGTTHEFRNILAIVGESAGLIQDVVQASGSAGVVSGESVLRAVRRIEKQVARGADLVSALNGLAHALDHESELLDLAEQARHAAVLCRHWLASADRRVTVSAEAVLQVQANRLQLCQVLAAAIECAAPIAPAGSELLVSIALHHDRAALRLRCESARAVAAPLAGTAEWDRLAGAAAAIGASVEAAEGGREVVVLFPGSPERA